MQVMRCFVFGFEKYIGKLNLNCESFWQRLKCNSNDLDVVWYDNFLVGYNSLGNFMKIIFMKVEFLIVYINYCICVMCIIGLDQCGIEV